MRKRILIDILKIMIIRIKAVVLLGVFAFFTSCNSGNKADKTKDETKKIADSTVKVDYLLVAQNVLKSVKDKNFDAFVEFVHPTEGVRFSVSAVVDVKHDKSLTKAQILDLKKSKKKTKWAIHEAIGDPINLNINDYFNQYFYDVDYLKLAKNQLNKSTLNPSSPSNIKEIYPSLNYVEFYYAGDGNKYSGLDWKNLTLVFKNESDKTYLVGVIHSEWTP